tara:strand:+ start:5464 stop:5985 length:522 start_codon:yes stop_codon:yes gene_type:complete
MEKDTTIDDIIKKNHSAHILSAQTHYLSRYHKSKDIPSQDINWAEIPSEIHMMVLKLQLNSMKVVDNLPYECLRNEILYLLERIKKKMLTVQVPKDNNNKEFYLDINRDIVFSYYDEYQSKYEDKELEELVQFQYIDYFINAYIFKSITTGRIFSTKNVPDFFYNVKKIFEFR